jgi:alpha-tubulin suppressor-like RCC1 family protein
MPTQCEIQTCINNLTCSSDLTEMVVLAAETNDITVDRSIPVANVNSLPDLALGTISVGTIFFIQSLSIPVVAGVGSWMTLDNRVVRQDVYENTIWSWGRNLYGQLGTDNTTNRSSPVSVVGGFTDWSHIAGGRIVAGSNMFGVRTNGTAWGWGRNLYGNLGDNTITSRSSPVSVVGGFTDWLLVEGGSNTLGLRQNGTLWAWGRNSYGALGDNTIVSKRSPVSVIGGFCDWCQISTGSKFSAAIRTNGTLWAWGQNSCGALGDNTTVNKSSPVSVVGGFTDWCQLSAGMFSVSAVRQNGTAWAWGCNVYGSLGDNSTVSKSSPVSVVGGFTDWCQIVQSGNNSNSLGLAVRQNGTAWAWGYNGSGQLGDNTTVSKSSPVSVVGGYTDWCQVTSSYGRSAAGIRQNGTLWAWGFNNCGQLGNNTITSRSSPVSVVGGFCDWCQVTGINQGAFSGLRST